MESVKGKHPEDESSLYDSFAFLALSPSQAN